MARSIGSVGSSSLLLSRPYRAPELLFGPRSYDALASDLWSLGVTIADFFTSIRHSSRNEDDELGDDSDSEEDEDPRTKPYVPPKDIDVSSDTFDDSWERWCLFDSDRGDIGLIWSIFKTRGTANEENWPVGQSDITAVLWLTD